MTEREEELKDALEDMVNQFAYTGTGKKGPVMHTGGLSALEHAFSVLGYEDPKEIPWAKCEAKGCKQYASCGTNLPDKSRYIHCCGDHYRRNARGESFKLDPSPKKEAEGLLAKEEKA